MTAPRTNGPVYPEGPSGWTYLWLIPLLLVLAALAGLSYPLRRAAWSVK